MFRRREFNIFNLSFLDVICCALGGVLVLLMFTMLRQSEETARMAKLNVIVEGLAQQLAQTKEAKAEAEKEFGKEKETIAGQLAQTEAEKAEAEKKFGEEKKKIKGQLAQTDQEKAEAQIRLGELIEKLTGQLAATNIEKAKAKQKFDDVKKELEGQLAATNIDKAKAKQSFDDEKKELDGQLAKTRDELSTAKKEFGKEKETLGGALATVKKSLAISQEELDELRKSAANVVTLRGPMKRVVFVFDTSDSLKKNQRFGDYTAVLKSWIETLRFEQFSLIEYDDRILIDPMFAEDLREGTRDVRKFACELVDKFQPDGRTLTRKALARALAYPDVDTIILFTDGRPTDEDGNELDPEGMTKILDWLKKEHEKVVINTIAIGDYMEKNRKPEGNATREMSYGEFLQEMARNHNGAFLGF